MTSKTIELADAIAARFTETVGSGLATKADLDKLAAQFAALEVAIHALAASLGGTAVGAVTAAAPKVAARPVVGVAEKKQAINVWFATQVGAGSLREYVTPEFIQAAAAEIAAMKTKPAPDSPEYWKKVAGIAWKMMDKGVRDTDIRAVYNAWGKQPAQVGTALEADDDA